MKEKLVSHSGFRGSPEIEEVVHILLSLMTSDQ